MAPQVVISRRAETATFPPAYIDTGFGNDPIAIEFADAILICQLHGCNTEVIFAQSWTARVLASARK